MTGGGWGPGVHRGVKVLRTGLQVWVAGRGRWTSTGLHMCVRFGAQGPPDPGTDSEAKVCTLHPYNRTETLYPRMGGTRGFG